MVLDPGDLNEWDERILDYLRDEGRASPTLLVKIFAQEDGADVSRQWINSRLTRLEEHDHVRNVLETGIYELVDDPRTGE